MLGAGKTTFIGQFIRNNTGKVVVLVNDFGKVGIDGEIFSAKGIESIELPSGCVCCTLKFDLIAAIQKIKDAFAPEHLLIEPSGIASPSGILEAFDILKITSFTVVGIIDAAEFLELNHEDAFGRFFEDQITNSDIILVNKSDLVGHEITDKTVQIIAQMNPCAMIYRTVNCRTEAPLPDISNTERVIDRHVPHFSFETLSLRLGDDLDLEAVSSLFHDMSMGKYGDIVRAKALINTLQGPYKFDLSFTNVQSVMFEEPIHGSRLVIIGRGLNKEALSSVI